MANINFNHVNKEIIVSSSFNRKANKYGTSEAVIMSDLVSQYPGYKVVVKRKGETITYNQMEAYLRRHKPELVGEFLTMKNAEFTMESGKVEKKYTFFTMRKWFMNSCPEYKGVRNIEQEAEAEMADAQELEETTQKTKEIAQETNSYTFTLKNTTNPSVA